jgi:hypothetical protein
MLNIPNYGILDPVVSEPAGYVTKDGMWAAVPFVNRFMIIHNGKQIKVANTLDNAKKYIEAQIKALKKSTSSGTLEKIL